MPPTPAQRPDKGDDGDERVLTVIGKHEFWPVVPFGMIGENPPQDHLSKRSNLVWIQAVKL